MSRYINADALIAKWEEDIKHIPNASFRAMMQGAINEVTNAPTADVVEVVHGEWIDVNGDGSLLECGNCHEGSCCKGNYCSNCGAKMDERRTE